LARPLTAWWCAAAWFAATGVFISVTELLGGLSRDDALDSAYSTWAIAHGDPACAYFSSTGGLPFRPPLYPILSGALAWAFRIGNSTPFPSLGPHCASALTAMSRWSLRADALPATVRLGYAGWLVLMAGLVAALRAFGRGRSGWEPVTLVVAACAAPVFMTVERFFHPEDLVAMGLALGATACLRRGWWAWTGVLLGLAMVSQQFTLLVAIPLVVLAPSPGRRRMLAAGCAAAAAVALPLAVLTSGRVLAAIAGSGSLGPGDTVLSALHLRGAPLLFLCRVLPLACALVLAWWARRKFGEASLQPTVLAAVVATSLAFRLVFEVNLYGYYFMAVAVMLLLMDILRNQVSVHLVAWIALVALAFNPLPGSSAPNSEWLPLWLWQILLVGSSLGLAVAPLVTSRDRSPVGL